MADGNEVVSNIAISKVPAKAGLDAKFKALERAENAYYQGKGQAKQQVIQKLPLFCYCLFKGKVRKGIEFEMVIYMID
jgi:hypothetical protein